MPGDTNISDRTSRPAPFTPAVLYEDNHLLVVNKPANMLTQGDASGRVSLLEHLKDYLKVRDHKPGKVFLAMVQRLDFPVSGALVFAKTSKGATRMSAQVRDRRLSKYYLAVTPASQLASGSGADEEGGWYHYTHLVRRVGDRTVVVGDGPDTKTAVLKVRTLLTSQHFCFHLIQLITGRKHQIRAQLSALGIPVCGDGKYGSQVQVKSGRILLHSYLVQFEHPTQKNMVTVACPPPDELLSPFSSQECARILTSLKDALG